MVGCNVGGVEPVCFIAAESHILTSAVQETPTAEQLSLR